MTEIQYGPPPPGYTETNEPGVYRREVPASELMGATTSNENKDNGTLVALLHDDILHAISKRRVAIDVLSGGDDRNMYSAVISALAMTMGDFLVFKDESVIDSVLQSAVDVAKFQSAHVRKELVSVPVGGWSKPTPGESR